MAPTKRQGVILKTIQDLTAELGYPPTLLELSARLGLAAKSGCASQVKALATKGLLTVRPRTARSMLLTAEGQAWLAALEQPAAQQT